MPYIFGPLDEPDQDGILTITPSSRNTADVSPIPIKETEQVRFRIVPKLVENDKAREQSVAVRLVYERKRASDAAFPSDSEADNQRVMRDSIKSGNWLELILRPDETYALAQGLTDLYALHSSVGVPKTYKRFVEADAATAQAIELLKHDQMAIRMLGKEENYEILESVLRLLTQDDSREALRLSLSSLEEESIQRLNNTLSTEQLVRAATDFRQNIDNPHESYWQDSIFGKYPWILSQIFAAPMVMFSDKAYVGGKDINNRHGNECDFIFRNHMTKNVCLIEIKTPMKPILGTSYRGTYSLSTELSGAVNQVLNYRDSLMKSYHSLLHSGEASYEVFSPRCAVIIGNTAELDEEAKRSAFENFRNNLNGVTILTYDEVLQRIDELIQIMQ